MNLKIPWWIAPVLLVLIALGVWGASLFFWMDADHHVWMGPHKLEGTCAMITITGLPCPNCGMTRSWISAARFHPIAAIQYNPAGFLLFVLFTSTGIVGLVRLLTRSGTRWTPTVKMILIAVGFWMVVYLGGWLLRVGLQVNPLEGLEPHSPPENSLQIE